MRWERLFDELEASAADADRAEHRAEVADRTRRERSRIQLADRLLASEGAAVEVRVIGSDPVRGTVQRVGTQWVLISADGGAHSEVLIPMDAILAVAGLGRRAVTRPASSVASRLGLGHVLRGMSRDRSTVRIVLVDGYSVTGVIDGVAADHIDLAAHPADAQSPHRARTAVAFGAVATVSRWV